MITRKIGRTTRLHAGMISINEPREQSFPPSILYSTVLTQSSLLLFITPLVSLLSYSEFRRSLLLSYPANPLLSTRTSLASLNVPVQSLTSKWKSDIPVKAVKALNCNFFFQEKIYHPHKNVFTLCFQSADISHSSCRKFASEIQ